jgi:hypothetical protein
MGVRQGDSPQTKVGSGLARKSFLGTNTLAYLAPSSVTNKPSLITLTAANVIELYSSSKTIGPNELEWSTFQVLHSQAGLSRNYFKKA